MWLLIHAGIKVKTMLVKGATWICLFVIMQQLVCCCAIISWALCLTVLTPIWNLQPLEELFLIFNTLRPRQNGHHFPDDIFKCIFLNQDVWISIKVSLTFVPKGPIKNIPALFQIMAWRRSSDKPLSEPMMVSLLTHICVTRLQWVNTCII